MEPADRATDPLSVVEALALLTPYDINRVKARLGPDTDGGYILVPELFTDQTVFSYGISGEYRFDVEMIGRGHKVLMFDHTIDGIYNPSNHPNMIWFKEGVAGTRDESLPVDTIANHLAKHAPGGSDLILKMDVEGHEFESFDALPLSELRRFQQIVFEIHFLHDLEDEAYRARFVRVLKKINAAFTLFHVHANNYDGENALKLISGIPVSNLLELSYIRTDLVEREPSRTLYPTALDYPNLHPRDKKLWFFPFLPTSVGTGDFVAADRRIEAISKTRTL